MILRQNIAPAGKDSKWWQHALYEISIPGRSNATPFSSSGAVSRKLSWSSSHLQLLLIIYFFQSVNGFIATVQPQKRMLRDSCPAHVRSSRNLFQMVPQTKSSTPQTKESLPNMYIPKEERLVIAPERTIYPSEFNALSMMQTVMNADENDVVNEEDVSESSQNDQQPDDDDTDETSGATQTQTVNISRRQATLYQSGLLKNNDPKTPKQGATPKKTSVGERRIGSATQARRGVGRTTQLVNAVRKKAQGVAAAAASKSKTSNVSSKTDRADTDGKLKARLSAAKIQTAVEELLSKSPESTGRSQTDRFGSALSSWGKTMGILGEGGGRPETPVLARTPSLVVRLASPSDDVDIANLRLSVFSDVSPEMRSQFCFRSCQALAHRRSNGACCVVANQSTPSVRPVVLGSAECSYHEFQNTSLGRRRPDGSLLYITEVAVHPSARRQGIGAKLLKAMDTLAMQKDVETLFLHVDVANNGAISLYKKCGFDLADCEDPLYKEFTTSLNLHPGATRGRTHHLLFKNVKIPTWVEDPGRHEATRIMGNLGFKVPA